MADPITNSRFAAALFEPIQQAIAQRNQTALNLAIREQEAQRRAAAQASQNQFDRGLALMREEGAMERAAISERGADKRLETSLNRQESANTAAQERADQKELQDLRESINAAFRIYTESGGTDGLDAFGDMKSTSRADLLDMLGRVTQAASRQTVTAEAEAVESGLANLTARASAVNDQLMEQVQSYVEQEVAGAAAAEAGINEDFGEAYNKLLAQGAAPASALSALAQRFPQEVLNIRNIANRASIERSTSLRESKQFNDQFRALQDERELIMRSASKPGVSSELLRRRSAYTEPGAEAQQSGQPARTGSVDSVSSLLDIDFKPGQPTAPAAAAPAGGKGLFSMVKDLQESVPEWASKDLTQLAPAIGRGIKTSAGNADRFASTAIANLLFDTGDPVIDEVADRGLAARGADSFSNWLAGLGDRIRQQNVDMSRKINEAQARDRVELNALFGDPNP